MCLVTKTIKKGWKKTQPYTQVIATLNKKYFYKDIAQQLPVQTWTHSTLVTDFCSQGQLFQNNYVIFLIYFPLETLVFLYLSAYTRSLL